MRAASSVRWVWKCPGHSGTMLSAVAVSARGGSNTTDTERLASLYIGPRQLPHYSRWPMANRIGRVPTLTLRGIPRTKVAGPSLGKAPAADSTSQPRLTRIHHLFEPLLPLSPRLYLSFILCLVWFFDRTCPDVWKRIRFEGNKFEEIGNCSQNGSIC